MPNLRKSHQDNSRFTHQASQKESITTTNTDSILQDTTLLRNQAIVMALASAILGPLLDNQHSMHNVLAYTHPIRIQLPGLLIETTWWTPLLFGLAGVIIGLGLPVLDDLQPDSLDGTISSSYSKSLEPSWSWVLLGITLFVLQYWASAVLDVTLHGQTIPGIALPSIDVVLAVAAVATWGIFDKTPQGLFMAALTGVSGPAIEIFLISQGLYHYSHNEFLGAVPTWICWTYFAGGPAVGNLGRKTVAILKSKQLENK